MVAGSPPALVTVDMTKEVKAPTHGAWPRVALAEKGGKSLDRRGKNRIWELGTRTSNFGRTF